MPQKDLWTCGIQTDAACLGDSH